MFVKSSDCVCQVGFIKKIPHFLQQIIHCKINYMSPLLGISTHVVKPKFSICLCAYFIYIIYSDIYFDHPYLESTNVFSDIFINCTCVN